MAERKLPAPIPTPEGEAFFAAAREGRFTLRFCNDCGRAHWYPRAICPFCFSDATEWRSSPGRGVIYSYSVMRRADPPFALAYVTLDEGPTVMTNLVDCDFDALSIGQAVVVAFRDTEGGPPVAVFKPA